MRALWMILLILALSWGLWYLLGTDEDVAYDPLPPPPPVEETAPKAPAGHVYQTTGVLTVTVRTPEGTAPSGTEAGYRWGEGERVKPVDRRGQVRFTDAPLGDLVIVAHADGYRKGTQRRFLSSGVPTDVVLTLEEKDTELDG
jgi:hypothetical protein